jgi:hypothetical protein
MPFYRVVSSGNRRTPKQDYMPREMKITPYSSATIHMKRRAGERMPRRAWNSSANQLHAASAGPCSHRQRTAGQLRPQRPAAQQDKTVRPHGTAPPKPRVPDNTAKSIYRKLGT